MAMLRWLFIILMLWWLSRLVARVWRKVMVPRRSSDKARLHKNKTNDKSTLKDLTQQEISDADYEEIP